MKTLILISHPKFEDSGTQQFLKTSFYSLDDVKYQVIDELYADTGKIDIDKEQAALKAFDRIVFQFPMYWYSSPASLKQFMDDVFTRNYIVANRSLKTKELGIVVTLGDAEADFQAGGPEAFTISELLRPFQAFAHKAGMQYLKPFVVDQFGYMDPTQKQRMLIDYLQYLSAEMPLNLANREQWLVGRLQATKEGKSDEQQQAIDLVINSIEDQQNNVESLKEDVKMIRDQEE
ncbi:NAD(P)H-dependent oxidoreductase [Lentilactobacillus otakiensis]|uniref:NAD(P)H dehydrogenase n=2 Tax=Lentilactobacillus otakiensis TaxID=481720 RepID=S4NLT0_9LACO|nr:NAD(P)H-dependent oxidoreductase [Lentilactobacillus otakiensis]KRL11545.1 NAD(P)H dehydrogenase (quinone) [Lentilactobacillus otakiensis DSM 19908 = JCM 15040]MBZ3776833.1 NAD(P)H-dependent oxidoreductase [Lentilactobacillus otakiensis]GAD16856.1 NAD(P)H dehydrogenase [Lentilactobacillus otakiensis DSM 19908 = JCM 15040]